MLDSRLLGFLRIRELDLKWQSTVTTSSTLGMLFVLALVNSGSSSALAPSVISFFAMYKIFDTNDIVCGGNFQKIYYSDLNEARIDGNDTSISSSQCYKNRTGQNVSRSCNSTSKAMSISGFSSSGCSGLPDSDLTFFPNVSLSCFFISPLPPRIYMGCTLDEQLAKSQGYNDGDPVESGTDAAVTQEVRKECCVADLINVNANYLSQD
jgi:hypothetical protein